MQRTPSPDWSYRHRLQHAAFLSGGKVQPLNPQVSKRFAADFEAALRFRGNEAKTKSVTDATKQQVTQ